MVPAWAGASAAGPGPGPGGAKRRAAADSAYGENAAGFTPDSVPAPPPGHVAIPGLDLVDDTRPGMPRFGYASGAPLPDAPPEFIRDADDI